MFHILKSHSQICNKCLKDRSSLWTKIQRISSRASRLNKIYVCFNSQRNSHREIKLFLKSFQLEVILTIKNKASLLKIEAHSSRQRYFSSKYLSNQIMFSTVFLNWIKILNYKVKCTRRVKWDMKQMKMTKEHPSVT